MKNLYLLFFLLFFSGSLFSQIEVDEKQRSLIVKRTADWCPNCGTWGWSFFESLIEENAETASAIAAHHSGGLQTEVGLALTNAFGGSGQPNFFLGKDLISVNSGNWSSVKNTVKESIDNLYNGESPIASMGLRMSINNDDEIFLEGRTIFYQDFNADVYVSLFIIENNLVSMQSGQGDDALHQKTLRSELTGNAFGSLISQGAVESGTEVMLSVAFPQNPNLANDNLEIVAVLWEKNGEEYSFINTSSVSEFSEFVSSNKQVLSKEAYKISPNISEENISIHINALQNSSEADIKLFNLNGQLIKQIYKGEIRGSQNFEIQKSALNISAGIYLVNITMDGKSATEKVFFVE